MVSSNLYNNDELYSIYLEGEEIKLLCVPDVHLRETEFSGTRGYVETQEDVVLRLIKGAEAGLYNAIVLMGDFFDGPYKNLSKAFYHVALVERLYRAVDGRLFEVMSNHPINNKRNYMVTFFLTGVLKSARCSHYNLNIQKTLGGFEANFGISEPFIRVPDRLFINGNLFNFFHFDKENKDYYDPLHGVTYNKHIGLYHDNILTAEANAVVTELSNGGKFEIPSIKVNQNSPMMSNVDYAVFGDIHTKIGEFILELPHLERQVVMDIPGTLGRTANHRAQLHNEVFLPLFTISKNGDLKKEHIKFPLVDYRTIFKIEEQDEKKETKKKMDDFRENLTEISRYLSFDDYLDNDDSSPEVKALIRQIIKDKATVPKWVESDVYQKYVKQYSRRFE